MAAADEATPVRDTLYRSLALSTKVLAEDCIRETGHLIPETEKFRDLVSSQALEKLYDHAFEGDEEKSVGVILDSILDALVEKRDTAPVSASLCEECGYIILREKPEKCPQCTSTSLQSV